MDGPQSGIFVEGSRHHYALEYILRPDAERLDVATAVRKALAEVSSATNVVVAFGPALWKVLAADGLPPGLRPFERLGSLTKVQAPATQRDLLFWLHGQQRDANFDAALGLQRALEAVADIGLEQSGFVRRESRDLTGFIDGTANPKADEARKAALVPEGVAGAGGSFVLTQRWVHDLKRFGRLPVPEQERVIGRTKADSVQLQGSAMPPDSHVSRTDVKRDGVGLKIYRRSFPYGSVTEHGLYFLAFTCDIERFVVILHRMYGVFGDGLHDRLTEFSRPVSGAYWFAPSEEDMKAAIGS